MKPLRIASRRSPLALRQVQLVKQALSKIDPDLDFEVIEVATKPDRAPKMNLSEFKGTGAFTKEVTKAVELGAADVAVHSAKDLPANLGSSTVLHFIEREDPRDCLIGLKLEDLNLNMEIATSSNRRRAQLSTRYPNLKFSDCRGNIETRISKISPKQGLVLAVAGLKRLGLDNKITHTFSPKELVPQVGQGAIAIESMADSAVSELIKGVNHKTTEICVSLERLFLAKFGANCDSPVAGYCRETNEGYEFIAWVGDSKFNGRFEVFQLDPRNDLGVQIYKIQEHMSIYWSRA